MTPRKPLVIVNGLHIEMPTGDQITPAAHGVQAAAATPMHALADATYAGFMSSADKTRLDGLRLWARLYADSSLSLVGPATVDGRAVATGDRVLAGGQSNATELGVWIANIAAGASWTRAPEAPAGATWEPGADVFIFTGDVYYFQRMQVNSATPIVLGTTTGWSFYKSMTRANVAEDSNEGAIPIGTSGFSGQVAWWARGDHRHGHGAQTDPTLHALASNSSGGGASPGAGFMSQLDKAKLDSVRMQGLLYVPYLAAGTYSYIIPAGCMLVGVWIRPAAGGGGGGGSGGRGASASTAGGGGGGGGQPGGSCVSHFVPYREFSAGAAELMITVGAGGAGGAGGSNSGAAGSPGSDGGLSYVMGTADVNRRIAAGRTLTSGGQGGAGGALGGSASGATVGSGGSAGTGAGARWPSETPPVGWAGGAGGAASAAGNAGSIPSAAGTVCLLWVPQAIPVGTAGAAGAASSTRGGGGGGGPGGSAAPGDDYQGPTGSQYLGGGTGGNGGAGGVGNNAGTSVAGGTGSVGVDGSQGHGGGGGGGGGASGASSTGQGPFSAGAAGGKGSDGAIVLVIANMN